MNHHFLGDVINWYMRWPGGLHIENSRRAAVRPVFISGLEWAKASHSLPAGELSASWRRDGDVIFLEVQVPEGVACRFILPEGFVLEDSGNAFVDEIKPGCSAFRVAAAGSVAHTWPGEQK